MKKIILAVALMLAQPTTGSIRGTIPTPPVDNWCFAVDPYGNYILIECPLFANGFES